MIDLNIVKICAIGPKRFMFIRCDEHLYSVRISKPLFVKLLRKGVPVCQSLGK